MLQTYLKRAKPLTLWLFWLVLIAVSILLLVELPPSEPGWPYFDKVVHATMFFTLGVLGYIAYNKHKLTLCIGLACYGVATEYLQSAYTETRFGSIYDWLADLIGILLSLVLVSIIKMIYAKKTLNGS